MPQITYADLARASNPGLGQAADPAAFNAQADALDAQAAALQGVPGQEGTVAALQQQSASLRQAASDASSAQTRADALAIGKSALTAGAAFAPAAIKLFGGGGAAPSFMAPRPNFVVPPSAGGGMTTGTKVALGLGALAAAGFLIWALRK